MEADDHVQGGCLGAVNGIATAGVVLRSALPRNAPRTGGTCPSVERISCEFSQEVRGFREARSARLRASKRLPLAAFTATTAAASTMGDAA